MSAEPTMPRESEAGGAQAPSPRPSAEQRAEAIVEAVSERTVRFARRIVARAREEAEDIVAEAQSVRRGKRPRESDP